MCTINQNEKNYQDYYHKTFVTESRPIKKVKNHFNTNRIKSEASDTQQTTDEYYIDYSYYAKKKESPSSFSKINKKLFVENYNNIRKNKNAKNIDNNIQPSYNDNNTDIIRINTFTYFSEANVKTKGRSVSSAKKDNCFENKLVGGKTANKAENNPKVLNRIELDNNKNNCNTIISKINNKNNSTKIAYKTRSNHNRYSNDLNQDMIIPEQKLARYVRRNNKNGKCLSFNESNLNGICDNTLNTIENKYIKNKNKFFKVNNFEIKYETDKEERKNCINSQYNHKNTMTKIISYPYQNEFKYNIYYNNIINLEDSNKYNNNNYEEINENTYDTSSNTNYEPYKYNSIHTSNLNENSKKTINLYEKMIDSYGDSDIFNHINNKSDAFGSVKRRKAKSKNFNKSTNHIKNNKTNSIKHLESQNFINNIKNNSIDIKINSPNSNHNIIRTNYNTNSNNVLDNTSTAHSISVILKKNSNSSLSNNLNSSKMRKKTFSQVSQKKKGKKYFKKNDLKKIILIQSKYRSHLFNLKMSSNLYFNIRELIIILKDIFIFHYWKYFIQKLSEISINKLIKNKKPKNANKKNSMKKHYNSKLLYKSNETNLSPRELGETFNIKNDSNYLKLKLNDVIKENSELKNQIFDNRKIEEKLKQLQLENKKNQNINAIIMKDNQNLAKKLKNIQESRNNKLVIQIQNSLDLSQDDNNQMHSFSKLKYLNLKCLILKKFLKNGNILKIYFNKYRNNIIKEKDKDKANSIENNNIFINNRNKINMQMAKNFNINFFSQDDNYKYFILYKFFLKKDKLKKDILSKYIFKFFYISKYLKLYESIKNKEQEMNKEKKINEIEKIEKNNELKRSKLQSIIDKYERNIDFLFKNTYKEWKLRSVLFKMKDIAKEIKKRKKLKKKIREKMAKQTLNNLKNKASTFQSAHELSYKIDKEKGKENHDLDNQKNDSKKDEELDKNENSNNNNNVTETKEKNENENDQDDSESSFGLDD